MRRHAAAVGLVHDPPLIQVAGALAAVLAVLLFAVRAWRQRREAAQKRRKRRSSLNVAYSLRVVAPEPKQRTRRRSRALWLAAGAHARQEGRVRLALRSLYQAVAVLGKLSSAVLSGVEDDDCAELGDTAEVASSPVRLTPVELDWIRRVRGAILAQSMAACGSDRELRRCSNVLLVRLAIVCKGRASQALRRLRKLRGWEERFSLDGLSFADAFTESQVASSRVPGGNFAAMGRTAAGGLGFGCDYSSFIPSRLASRVAFKCIIGVFERCTSSLADVRTGVTIVANVKGVGYSNVSLAKELEFAGLYVEGYPVRIAQIVLVDVTFVARAILRGLLVVLPAKLASRFLVISRSQLGTYASLDTLPPFFGGGAHAPESAAHWAGLAERGAEWESELVQEYGPQFDRLESSQENAGVYHQ